MKREKIILVLVASAIGLLVASGSFYLYQKGKEIKSDEIKNISAVTPTPKPKSLFLSIEKPKNEEVLTSKTVQINGETQKDAKILIITALGEETATPATDGSFSTTITLSEGENLIEFIAIAPTGETAVQRRVVSIATEDF